VVPARKLESSNILITSDSRETKNLTLHKKEWTKVIANKAKIKRQQLTVIAHVVKTNGISTANQEKALAKLQAQYSQLKDKIQFCQWTEQQEALKTGKLQGLLLICSRTTEVVFTLVQEGLFYNLKLKMSVPIDT
jgi:hypothetical protein